MKKPNSVELRRALLNDILYEDDPNYAGTPLELPTSPLLETAFVDITLVEWCRAVGVTFTVNRNPDPAFNSKTTLLFQSIPNLKLNKDEEL